MSNDQREVIELDVAGFQRLLEKDEVVVIDISAPWCGPCKAFTEVFRDVAAVHDDVVFASIDSDEQLELGAAFNVTSIPAVAVMRAGALIFLHQGSLGKEALADVIRQARSVDVDAVRKSVVTRPASA